MQSIKQIFSIKTVVELEAARDQFEEELSVKLQPLLGKLESNILSSDVASIEQHMAYVESWRARLVRYHSFASAFTDHAKDSTFLASKLAESGEKIVKTPEIERDAYRRKLAGGFSALLVYLEGLIDSVDSRVNISKKVLGIEADAPRTRATA